MGGRTIEGILRRGEKELRQLGFLVIEPQSEVSLPIRFLLENGYQNDEGLMIRETRIYPLLRFIKNPIRKSYNIYEQSFGPAVWEKRDPLLKELLSEELTLLTSLPEAGARRQEKRIAFLRGGLDLWISSAS